MRRFYRDLKAALLAVAMTSDRRRPPARPRPSRHSPCSDRRWTPACCAICRLANNPFSVLETLQPETIGNLFAAGGLNAATAPKVGGFLNSWTQTQFRIGDITVTDPRAGGTPLVLPALPFWERITTATAAMGVDDNAPGGVDDDRAAAARCEVVARRRRTDLGSGPGVGRGQSGAGRRSRAPGAGRQRPDQRPAHQPAGARRRRIVARTVACGGAGRERDSRPGGVRAGASGVRGDTARRSPRLWLGDSASPRRPPPIRRCTCSRPGSGAIRRS